MPGWADLQPSSGTDDLGLAGLSLALVCQVIIDYAKSQ